MRELRSWQPGVVQYRVSRHRKIFLGPTALVRARAIPEGGGIPGPWPAFLVSELQQATGISYSGNFEGGAPWDHGVRVLHTIA